MVLLLRWRSGAEISCWCISKDTAINRDNGDKIGSSKWLCDYMIIFIWEGLNLWWCFIWKNCHYQQSLLSINIAALPYHDLSCNGVAVDIGVPTIAPMIKVLIYLFYIISRYNVWRNPDRNWSYQCKVRLETTTMTLVAVLLTITLVDGIASTLFFTHPMTYFEY